MGGSVRNIKGKTVDHEEYNLTNRRQPAHPFGALLSQHLHRRGLSQAKLAAGILQEPAMITRMGKGERLTGPRARERVRAIIGWLHKHDVLSKRSEADGLLLAAGLAPLRETDPVEATLLSQLLDGPDHEPMLAPKPPLVLSPEFALVGRQAEWQTLRAAWQTAMQGAAHVVTIAGEAGIGKTRLAEELMVEGQQQGHAVAHTRAYAMEGRLAYAPLADWLRSPAVINSVNALNAVWRGELAKLLPELLIADSILPAPQPMTERWQLKRLFEAILQAFSAAQQSKPLLLVLDDLQWCDAETLEWLQYALGTAPHLKLLVVGTVRDTEVDAEHSLHKLWRGLLRDGQLTQIALSPLSQAETTSLGAAIADQALGTDAAQCLFQDCAGNPLFIIESVRSQQEPRRQPSNPLTQSSGQVALTPKVYAVIQFRLTQLSPEAREAAELAAVIGRSFNIALLAQASQQAEGDVVRALDELWRRRIVRERAAAQYDFSHDRIRDVAYEEMGSVRRRVLHLRVATALERQLSDDLENRNTQLAIHYHAAGDTNTAIACLIQAIQIALNLSATQNALTLVALGLRMLQELPESGETLRQMAELYFQQGTLLEEHKGWTDLDAQVAFKHVRHLGHELNDPLLIFAGQNKQRFYHSLLAEWPKAKIIAEQNVALAEQLKQPRLLADAYGGLGRANLYQGELHSARQSLEIALSHARDLQPANGLVNLNHPTVYIFTNIAHCVCLLGYPQLAKQHMNEGLHVARQQDVFTNVTSLHFDQILNHMLRDMTAIRRATDEMNQLARKHEFPYFVEMSQLFDGWLLAQLEHRPEGVEKLKRSVQNFEAQNMGMFHMHRFGMLAEAYLLTEDYEQGLNVCNRAIAFAERTTDAFWLPEIYRLKADLLQKEAPVATQAIEESYQQAIDLAKQQSSKWLELRSSVSLARLWQAHGKTTQAHQLLAVIYGWFTEGFDTPDLQEANALLAELG